MSDLDVIREFLKWAKEEKEIELCYFTDDCDSPWVNMLEPYVECIVTQFGERDLHEAGSDTDKNN